jgi:DNA-binding transcriptional LysR family regulator
MTLDGICVAVLPSYLVESHVGSGDLVELEPRRRRGGTQATMNTLYLAWRRGTVEAGRFVAVRDALTDTQTSARSLEMAENENGRRSDRLPSGD